MPIPRFRYRIFIIVICFAIAYIAVDRLSSSDNTKANAFLTENIQPNKKADTLFNLRKQKLATALQDYFQKAIKSGEIVGVGISVTQGDSIVVAKGFGKRSEANKDRVNGETVFRLGSLSKGFTGVLAASLKAENKINWNDQVVKYLPEFRFGDLTNTRKVKIAHILSHTSGTPYHSFTNLVEAGLPMKTIASRFGEVAPISEPGKQYSYQNAMFSLSQEIVKKVTGQDAKSLLTNRFFKPLQMETISMNHEDLVKNKNVAMPHRKRKNGWKALPLRDRYYNAVTAGGINASALDMAKWMRFLLGHNPEIMKEKDLQDVFTPFVAINNHRKYYQRWSGHLKSSYGFGWRIHEFEGSRKHKNLRVWHHGGSVNNYRNEIALFPDKDLGICVLMNGNSKIARTVIPDIYKIVAQVYEKTEQRDEILASNTYE